MAKKKNINFALLGLGKLGKGFYDTLQEKKDRIEQETGFTLQLKKILVKNAHFKRAHYIDPQLITTDVSDILKDKSIEIAIDAIGGIEPTFSLIKKLIARRINIISANRMMLASKMHELADLANENNVFILPGPSLGGGIPIIETLREYLVANDIKSMTAVVSGTSNFILSEMTRHEIPLKEVLKNHRLQKVAESLSIIDYEGSDAAQKVSVIAASAFGLDVNFLDIYSEGISDVTVADIQSARHFNYEIKQLAIIKEHKNKFEIHVHPTLVPKDHPLTLIREEYNAFFIESDLLGKYMVYGRGVGIKPASSSILSNLISLGKLLRYTASIKVAYQLVWNDMPLMAMEEIESAYYLRFPCLDIPGVVGKITTILGKHDINIGSAHAEVEQGTGFVHILIDLAREESINRALKEIEKLEIIRDKIKLFRILKES